MNLDSLSFGLAEISHAIANLSKKTYKPYVSEINHIVSTHGQEAERHLFRCLFSTIDFSADGKNPNGKDAYQIQLLQQECASLIAKSNAASILNFAIETPLNTQKTLKPSGTLLTQISKVLKLTKLQEVVFGIILQQSTNADLRTHARNSTKIKFPDLITIFLDQDRSNESGLQDAPIEVVHLLLLHLLEPHNPSSIKDDLKNSFIERLRTDFPRERAPIVLTPLLFDMQLDMSTDQLTQTSISLPKSVTDTSLADCLREIGYSCTSDKDRCRQTITQLGGVREVTPSAVAQVLGMMARNIEGLRDFIHVQTLNMPNSLWVSEQRPETSGQRTWNVDIFIQVIMELSPSLNWREVVKAFDHPDFFISNKMSLQLIVMSVRKALHGAFPVDELYKLWNNTEGQLSWFVHALKNPEIFCFSNFAHQQINLDNLKTMPDLDNPDLATWKIPDLVETLLKLSEKGHYQQVSELFKVPQQQYPDVLVLNLLQCSNETWKILLKRELLMELVQIFLNNHPNSSSVLNCVWNWSTPYMNTLRSLVMQCLIEWYFKPTDPLEPRENKLTERLSRILDVAQDLKALSLLLNATQFPFILELACLASRREFLKLDKWLNDKIREHRDQFVLAIVDFLKRKVPTLMGGKEDLPVQSGNKLVSAETVATILTILSQITSGLQLDDLVRDIQTMLQHAGPLINKPRQITSFPPTPVEGGGFPVPGGISTSINEPPGGSPAKFPPGVAGAAAANLQNIPRTVHPDLMPNRPPNPPNMPIPQIPRTQEPPSQNQQTYSEEVEERANQFFQKLYNLPPKPTLSIDELLSILRRFKDSSNQLERNIFTCMLRNLFEEKQFFPQYPDRELLITAQLFGGIIDNGLIQHMALGLALRHVLEAVQSDPKSKMFYFGLAALDRFKQRLKDLGPQYCSHIINIPHFKQFPTHIIEFVEYGMNKQEPPPKQQTQQTTTALPNLPQSTTGAPPPPTSSQNPSAPGSRVPGAIGLPTTGKTNKPSLGHPTNIDTLLAGADEKEEIIIPPEHEQDKVFFIFNNLSQINMTQKAEELLKTLKAEFMAWAAQYLVMKRASIEPNFHPLYSSFLDHLDKQILTDRVMIETFRNIKVLLRSDKKVSNFSDRALLKNLGHWLGLITLARNMPILDDDLDMKELLYEAFQKGSEELLYVVPFVAKVLESAEKSEIFKPRNPWTMGILNVLAELHQQPELKLNLKFEVEVLCKNLSMEVTHLSPGNYLSVPNRAIEPQLTVKRKEDILHHYTVDGQSAGDNMMINAGIRGQTANTESQIQQQPSQTSGQINQSSAITAMLYSWNDINTMSLQSIAPLIQAPDHLVIFQHNKNFKAFVRPAVERTIADLLTPVIERTFKSVASCVEMLIKKDFALDHEEQRMRTAAQHMARHIICGMALVTCREPLIIALTNHLKAAFNGNMNRTQTLPKELIDQSVMAIVNENTQLCCAFICKAAVEKILPEIDRQLSKEYEQRNNARNEGRRYCDPIEMSQQEKLPEQIRLKIGAPPVQQMTVYEDFSKSLPGFAGGIGSVNLAGELLGNQNVNRVNMNIYAEEVGNNLEKISSEIENSVIPSLTSKTSASSHQGLIKALQTLAENLKLTIQQGSRDISNACLTIITKTVESFLEFYNSSITDVEFAHKFRDSHLMVLKCIRDQRAFGPTGTNKQVTRALIDCRDDLKYNDEAVEALIRNGYVIVQQFDYSMANIMESGMNYVAVTFAMKIVKRLILDSKNSIVTDTDLCNTVDMLMRIAQSGRPAPDGLSSLIENVRAVCDTGLFPGAGSGAAMLKSGINQAKDQSDDPPQLSEKTEFLLREWVAYYHSGQSSRDGVKGNFFNNFLQQMHSYGVLRSDDVITRFIRLCTEMCVDITYTTLKATALQPNPATQAIIRNKCFQTLDPFVRLLSLLIKMAGENNNLQAKVNLLNKVLGLIGGVLIQDHTARKLDFQQLPYHRILIMLYIELTSESNMIDVNMNHYVLNAYSSILRYLRPQLVPGFAFAWLEIVAHRLFVSRMLANTTAHKGWNMYAQILLDLFSFLAPFLRNADLGRAMFTLYKGALRLLLLLIHDFPEFLADYHFHFCDVIPTNCIQMRNLILSAYPRSMRMPDPLMPTLKMDMISDMNHMPRKTPIPIQIQPESFKIELDNYLNSGQPSTYPSDIRLQLLSKTSEDDKYNIPVINAVTLHVGNQAITALQNKGQSVSVISISTTPHREIFYRLSHELDTEGRYLLLNAIVNQLRFPNSHTNYFSCLLLDLFTDGNDQTKEQIARVLVERVTVNRPHPWGLLATFMELCRNSAYNFWSQNFITCAPEIENLFQSLTRPPTAMMRSQTNPASE